MTTTEQSVDAYYAHGRPATSIPPIECPYWCSDPGHVAEHAREDQNCYSTTTSVVSSLDPVTVGKYGVEESRISAMAYRGFGKVPVVLVHVEGWQNGLDEELRFTIDEARQLARDLLTAADFVIDGNHFGVAPVLPTVRPRPLSRGGVELALGTCLIPLHTRVASNSQVRGVL